MPLVLMRNSDRFRLGLGWVEVYFLEDPNPLRLAPAFQPLGPLGDIEVANTDPVGKDL